MGLCNIWRILIFLVTHTHTSKYEFYTHAYDVSVAQSVIDNVSSGARIGLFTCALSTQNSGDSNDSTVMGF